MQHATRKPPHTSHTTPRSIAPNSMFDVRPFPPASHSYLPSSIFYLLSLSLFALGLMSKPMLVTLPFVLLLLNYWPLGRSAECGVPVLRNSTAEGGRSAESGEEPGQFRPAAWGQLLLEKAPFLLLAALSSGATLWAEAIGGAVPTITSLPVAIRIANAVLSYYRYIGKA